MTDPLVTGLPSDPDTERLVLGAMLTDQEAVAPVAAALTPEEFTVEAHRRIYRAILALHERGEAIEWNTVHFELQRAGHAESVGGLSYLVSLDDGLPRIYGLDSYVAWLTEKATLRRAALAHQRCLDAILSGQAGASEALAAIERLGRDLGDNPPRRNRLRSAAEIFAEVGVEAVLNPTTQRDGALTIRLPWKALDEMLGGFRPGQLIVLAARPAAGKSAMAAQIATRAAEERKAAALFSLEMAASEVLQRVACGRATVDSARARCVRLNAGERSNLLTAASGVAELPLFLDDQTGATVPSLTASVRALRGKADVRLIVIDYLQLMTATGRAENRNVEVGAISRGLKRFALEAQVPILALSQLTRDPERQSRRPNLSDLRDSGSIEQDADVVLFLHGSDHEQRGDNREVQVLVAKNRGGPTGRVSLVFEARYTRFAEPGDAAIAA